MKDKNDKASEGRRGFLKMASVGTVAGAATALVGADASAAGAPDQPVRDGGYRETAHVKKVYDLARF